jgi:hypothetical protein
LSSADAAAVCAAPPGFNLSFPEIPPPPKALPDGSFPKTPSAAVTWPAEVFSTAPQPLPQLLSTGVGVAYDVKKGVHTQAVRAWSYDSQKQWLSPYSRANYQLPDMIDLSIQPAACLKLEFNFIANASAVVVMAAKVTDTFFSLKIPIPYTDHKVKLGITGNFLKIQADISAHLDAYAKMEVSLSFSLALFKLTHSPVLPQAGETSPLMKSLKALPATAGPAYDDFVSEFGTHYVNSEMFGGYCNFTAELDAKALVDFTWDMKYSQSVLKISLSIMRVLKVWCM